MPYVSLHSWLPQALPMLIKSIVADVLPTGDLDIPITMGDVCGFHCGFKAFEDARDIDGCTALYV